MLPIGGGRSMGSGGSCICPKCGAKMLREGSEHHEILKRKRKN